MSVKKIVAINLVVSSLALAVSGVAVAVNYIDSDPVEPITCECVCEVEETTEPVVEQIEEVTVAETETEVKESIKTTNLGRFKLTAYCACAKCCGKSDGITATGTKATQGRTIAVDPKVIPYGTEVIINGHTYVAEDCGGSIKSNRIDIYFDSHKEALKFGVQYADVYIVGS